MRSGPPPLSEPSCQAGEHVRKSLSRDLFARERNHAVVPVPQPPLPPPPASSPPPHTRARGTGRPLPASWPSPPTPFRLPPQQPTRFLAAARQVRHFARSFRAHLDGAMLAPLQRRAPSVSLARCWVAGVLRGAWRGSCDRLAPVAPWLGERAPWLGAGLHSGLRRVCSVGGANKV